MESTKRLGSDAIMRNKREKLLLTVAVLAVAILAGDQLVLRPLWSSSQTRAAKIDGLKKKVDEGNELLLPRSVTSITESGGTATVITTDPHPFRTGDKVYFSGATPTAYNISHASITRTSENSFTFSIGGSPGNATGTMLVRRGDEEEWRTYLHDNLNSINSIAEDAVLRAIENWMDDSGILLTSIKPQWQNHEDRYKTYDVRLVAEGTMREAVEFVHAIESDELPLKIEQLELYSREKTGQLISVSVHFTGLQLGEALR